MDNFLQIELIRALPDYYERNLTWRDNFFQMLNKYPNIETRFFFPLHHQSYLQLVQYMNEGAESYSVTFPDHLAISQ